MLVLIGSLLMSTGCSVHPRTPVGIGTYSYVNGRLAWTYPVGLDDLRKATQAVLPEFRLKIQKQAHDGLGGVIEALAGEKTKVRFDLKPLSDRTTRLLIRYGKFGSHKPSARIHEAVQTRLGFQ